MNPTPSSYSPRPNVCPLPRLNSPPRRRPDELHRWVAVPFSSEFNLKTLQVPNTPRKFSARIPLGVQQKAPKDRIPKAPRIPRTREIFLSRYLYFPPNCARVLFPQKRKDIIEHVMSDPLLSGCPGAPKIVRTRK